VSYPLAFFIASRSPGRRYLWLALVIIPFCTNLVIRTYGWMLLLSNQMPPARLAQWLGWIGPDMALYPSRLAVYVGMVSSSLPFAVLPIYTNVEHLDWSLVEAAQDLYAGKRGTFLHGILPQTLPGLLAAIILTFIPALGSFVVPDLLGGARVWLVGNLIEQEFRGSQDWPFGAAVSMGLMLLTLVGLYLLRRKGGEVQAP
jgi:spermidine/putrescine transport system permease protein